MKTIILTKNELETLPIEVQEKIMDVYNNRQNEIKTLKERINKLKYKSFSYRDDRNSIEDFSELEEKNILVFEIWQKNAGEQWGNCSGNKYSIKLGNKFIKISGYHFCTNQQDFDISEIEISTSKLSEILDLLEEFERNENEIDSDKILKIAISRFSNLVENQY